MIVTALLLLGQAVPAMLPITSYGDYLTGGPLGGTDSVPHPASFQYDDAAGHRSTRPIDQLRPMLAQCKRSTTSGTIAAYKWTGNCPDLADGQQLLLTVTGTRTAVTGVSVRIGNGPMLIPPAPAAFVKKHK